mgnify:FL=1
MLYKQLEDNSWIRAETEVILPDGTEINEKNQTQGWVFSKTEPKEYLIWLDSQKEILELKGE